MDILDNIYGNMVSLWVYLWRRGYIYIYHYIYYMCLFYSIIIPITINSLFTLLEIREAILILFFSSSSVLSFFFFFVCFLIYFFFHTTYQPYYLSLNVLISIMYIELFNSSPFHEKKKEKKKEFTFYLFFSKVWIFPSRL
jgi:hypothetical protein